MNPQATQQTDRCVLSRFSTRIRRILCGDKPKKSRDDASRARPRLLIALPRVLAARGTSLAAAAASPLPAGRSGDAGWRGRDRGSG